MCMYIIELMFITWWLISISIHLMWFYCSGYKSPFHAEKQNGKHSLDQVKSGGGAEFWNYKNCDDYLRYCSRQTYEQSYYLQRVIIIIIFMRKQDWLTTKDEDTNLMQWITMMILLVKRLFVFFYLNMFYTRYHDFEIA